jgi:hypothetical protein
MIISGNLLEVGTLNGNGWGISLEGAQDILSSLPGLPLKLCKDHMHACDYKPKTEAGAVIGKILSSARKKNNIHITADVNDQAAAYQILHGKYPRNWSIFAGYKDKDNAGYLTGAKSLGVSLVDTPAYPNAGYSIIPETAAAGYELSELEKYYLNTGQPQQAQKTNPGESLRHALEKLEKGKYQGK